MFIKKLQIFLFLSFINIMLSEKNQTKNNNKISNNSLLFPLENDTMNIKLTNETITFYINYNFKRKKFIIIILILISLFLILSLIYSLYKAPIKNYNCYVRSKYFFKGLIFFIFLPFTIICLGMNGIYGFIDGVFLDYSLNNNTTEGNKNFNKLNEEI